LEELSTITVQTFFCFVEIKGNVDHNISFNFNKTKESLNSDGRQFLQYQQTKRKFEQLWSKIPPISTNGGIVDHHC
jgi:hypothetical protein